MKTINQELLFQYGFQINNAKSNSTCIIYTKNKFEIAIKTDGSCYYTNMGFDYPLKDEEGLLKIYFEVRQEKLK